MYGGRRGEGGSQLGDPTTAIMSQLSQYFHDFFQEDELPGMRIIKLAEDMAKYRPESGELSEDNIRGFVQAYLDGKLKQHLSMHDHEEKIFLCFAI